MWTPLRETAVAIFSFHGREILPNYGIDLDLGDTVIISEQCGPWFYGYVKPRRDHRGVFPASYVKLKSSRSGMPRDSAMERADDPVAKEIASVLRCWCDIFKKLYVNGGATSFEYDQLKRCIQELGAGRLQLLTGTMTVDQLREIKLKLTAQIDWKNRLLGLDLIPRIGYEVVDPEDVGPVKLFHVHKKAVEDAEEDAREREAANNTTHKKRKKTALKLQQGVPHHLYCGVRDFSYQLSDCEVYLSLYDARKSQFVTERFVMKFHQNGLSSFVDKLQTMGTTVFEDLGYMDLNSDLYLVAHVVRIGKMFHSDSAKKANQAYKRPCMVGVLNIGEFVVPQSARNSVSEPEKGSEHKLLEMVPDTDDEREFTFKLYSGEEKDFSQLHDQLIKKQAKTSVISGTTGQYGLIVALKMLAGDLETVKLEHPVLLKTAVITRKMGFPDIIYPGDVRNDLYITLDRAEFEKGGKLWNVEASIVVLDSEGNVFHNSVFGASSSLGTEDYKSVILYHQNSPKWNETIRLTLPIEQFPDAHFRVEYRHCSTKDKNEKKLFGFSFAKLMDDEGTTLKDGSHDLFVYKCDDKTKLKNVRSYLGLPFSSTSVPIGGRVIGNQAFQRSLKESLSVSSLLVSTKLTQNMDLVNLLKWKSNPDRIKQTLDNMAHVSGEEIVKFLQDVLDALFSMFLSENGESCEYSGNVFIVLVNICVYLESGKFEHFKPVIEKYITDHFAAALVYKGLLSTLQHYADVCPKASKEFHPQIQRCFESLEFIFKFIVQSHILFTRAMGKQFSDSLSNNVRALFLSLNKTLDEKASSQVDISLLQGVLLKNLHKIYCELSRVMDKLDLTHLVCDLIRNIPLKESAHLLSPAKMTALRDLVNSNLFSDKGCRRVILPEVCKHLKHHITCRDELALCTDILDDILIFLYSLSKQADSRIHDDIETLSSSLLEVLVRVTLILDRRSHIVKNLVTCLVGLLQLMDTFHFNRLWDEFRESRPLRDLLLRVFMAFRDFIRFDVFSVDWAVMKLLSDSIVLKSMHQFAQPLKSDFLNNHSFDTQLWSQYFSVAVTFLTQPSLQLETFQAPKRDNILQRYGDMRVQMGSQILSMWKNLEENKIHFIPSLVGEFLEVTLIPEPELRKATLHVFYDMLDAEYRYHGDFKQFECELIDKLDHLVSNHKGDEEYRQLFNSILLEKIASLNPSWKSDGIAFVNSVTRLLERLLDNRNVLKGDDNRDKRMICTVNLLNFYNTEINRRELYLQYIYKLHDLHMSAENYEEAGFTLLLHAEMLGWGTNHLPPDSRSSKIECESERKEAIYLKALEYFDKGKLWEEALPLCKELAILYEFKLYEYGKLSQILKQSAAFFENILTQLRPEHEYFRVGFFGSGFPSFVRNKEFIYRGLEYERLASFIQRILAEWPSATVLKNIVPPDDSILNSDGQFIQISNVKPMPDLANPIISKPEVPEKIQAYYLSNNVDTFQYDRRLHKLVVVEDPDNEFKNMWIERTKMRTSSPLPGILPWFEVVEKKVEELSPVRYACEKLEDVNRQLNSLINQYSTDSNRSVNPLSMRLQGVLDANVMGGLPKYRDAFFTQEFIQNNPDSASYVAKLKALILDQVTILNNGLTVHGKIAPEGMKPLHQRLLECFAQMKSTVETDFTYSPSSPLRRSESLRDAQSFHRHNSSRIVNTPLPPVPNGVKRLTTESSASNRSSTSSGYGHMVQSYEPNSSDEDDVYSKPTESKNYTEISTPPSSLVNSFVGINSPPPIPNRHSKRDHHPLSKYSSHSKSSEYILMPPNRVRELQSNEHAQIKNGHLKNSSSLVDDSPMSTLLSSLNDSFYTADGSPQSVRGSTGRNGNAYSVEDMTDGSPRIPVPPLPPRASIISNDRVSADSGISVPVLPKRQPKKVPLTPMSSTDSDKVSVSSTPSSPTKGAPPPVPPKPRSSMGNAIESESSYLNKLELMSMPESPSYEDRFENSTILTQTLQSNSLPPVVDTAGNDNLPGDAENNSIKVVHSPSRTSPRKQGSNSHKEFYTLPYKNSHNSKDKDKN